MKIKIRDLKPGHVLVGWYEFGLFYTWSPYRSVDSAPIPGEPWWAVHIGGSVWRFLPDTYAEVLDGPVVVQKAGNAYPHRCPACGGRAYVGLRSVEHAPGSGAITCMAR